MDSSKRCGPNQEIYGLTERCVCVSNAAYTPAGCVLCGENEVPGAAGCDCAPGFARGSGGACEAVPAGQGTACNASMPCADATFNHCEMGTSGDGYCTTTGCTGNGDCTGGYACDMGVTPSVCRRPPVGLNKPCTSNADCAGSEATYCDMFVSHTCLVEGCSLSPNNCFGGQDCCDLSAFGVPMPICIPMGACTQ